MSSFRTPSGHVTIIPPGLNDDGGGGQEIFQGEVQGGGQVRVFGPPPGYQGPVGLPAPAAVPALPGVPVAQYALPPPAAPSAQARSEMEDVVRQFLSYPDGGNQMLIELKAAVGRLVNDNETLREDNRRLATMLRDTVRPAGQPFTGEPPVAVRSLPGMREVAATPYTKEGGQARIFVPEAPVAPPPVPPSEEPKEDPVDNRFGKLEID